MHRMALTRLYIQQLTSIVMAIAALAFVVFAIINAYRLGANESVRRTGDVVGTFVGAIVDAYTQATHKR